MSKAADELRRMGPRELEKEEAKIRLAIRRGETLMRGFGVTRTQFPKREGATNPPLKKFKRRLATLLTIKKEKGVITR